MEVKTRILTKADELFMQYGIRSVSMDDIATQLGISKKTIYQYFADKDELVDAVVESDVKEMQLDCINCNEEAQDAIHEIFIMMEQIVIQFRNMNPMVVYDLGKFHLNAHQKFMEYKNKFLFRMIRENIERGIKEELYRPEVNVDVMTKFRLESIMMPFNMTIYSPAKYNPADVTREIIEHYVYGLATLKGHKLIQKYKQQRIKKKNNGKEKDIS